VLAFAPQLVARRVPCCARLVGLLASCVGAPCREGGPIAPRRLERRVAFLTRRFAPHAPRWQLVLWARQLALFGVVVASGVANVLVVPGTAAHKRTQLGLAALALVILLVVWRAHHVTQPFAYRYQNAIEAWLYASSVVLLALACLHLWLSDPVTALATEGSWADYAMLVVLLGGLLAAAFYGAERLWADRHQLRSTDLHAVLERADEAMDEPLRERLRDGTLRLLSCAWLVSAESDASLGRDAASGRPTMRRQQELPPAAFVTPEDAVAALGRGDRSILALS